MGFMEPNIWGPSYFIDIETRDGTEPLDMLDVLRGGVAMLRRLARAGTVDGTVILSRRQRARLRNAVAGYTDIAPHDVDVATLRQGWGAELSAPGYMDRTDLTVHDSEQEARAYLIETYDLCAMCLRDRPDGQHICDDCITDGHPDSDDHIPWILDRAGSTDHDYTDIEAGDVICDFGDHGRVIVVGTYLGRPVSVETAAREAAGFLVERLSESDAEMFPTDEDGEPIGWSISADDADTTVVS